MKYGLQVISSIGKVVIVLSLLLYTVAVLALWGLTKTENSIHQCVIAAQVLALLLTGYIVGRCLLFIMDELESVANVMRGGGKTYTGGLYVGTHKQPPPIPTASRATEQ